MSKETFSTNYTIGKDAYNRIVNICLEHGEKVVLIGGKTALSKSETKIRKALKESDIKILGTYFYGGEASYENVDILKNNKEIQEADMIFAIGGGKAIDTCKVLSEELNKPLFTFPTIASTCASTTSVCAMYNIDGSFKNLYWKKNPPKHIFIDTEIITQAPEIYLWAGIGDTLAKGYEPEFSSRGLELNYHNTIGINLSLQCKDSLLINAQKGMLDCVNNRISHELDETILSIIVTTGLVSNYVINDYNSCVAHAICYGFSQIKEVEENHLHGELVSYGVLVQLMLDNKIEEIKKILPFYESLNLPISYDRFNVNKNQIENVVQFASRVNDVKVAAIKVTSDNLLIAIEKLESLIKSF